MDNKAKVRKALERLNDIEQILNKSEAVEHFNKVDKG